MLLALVAGTLLVTATILIHYEVLRPTSRHLSELPVPPRFRILAVVIAAFVAHTIEVWLYGAAYWVLSDRLGFGALHAIEGQVGFEEYLYFSAVTYRTAGFGDLYPAGHLRLLSGVEALNGLMLVGWSASLTYLAMERYWPMHNGRRPRHNRADKT
jgi:Ion channel